MLTPNLSADVTAMIQNITVQGESERFWRIQRLEAIWNGQRYVCENRPSFWDTSVPLRQRAPCVQSHLPRTAGMRLAHLVMGERSFPAIVVKEGGYGVKASPAELALVQALIAQLVASSKLSIKAREYLIEGLKTGTSVALQSLEAGRPCIRILPAKWCTPVLTAAGEVEHLVIMYKTESDTPGVFQWYRRELGRGLDRVWAPVPVTSEPPKWDKLPLTSEVEIEFVPVVWTRCLAEGVDDECVIDGHALADGLENEVEALDMELSQYYRNALYNGDPQMIRTGVDSEDTAPVGEQGAVGGAFSWLNGKMTGRSGGGAQALKKAPGKVWNLPPGGDAKLLESSGSGATIIAGAIDQLRRVTTDALGVILADPDTMGKGDLSARALTLMFGPMLDTADNLRSTYGEAIVAIVGQLLRLCSGAKAIEDGVHLQTWEPALPVLARFHAVKAVMVDGVAQNVPVWVNPVIDIAWGDYFDQSWADVSQAVEAVSKATGGKAVLSQRQAVSMLGHLTGVVDVEAELAQLKVEAGQ